MEYREVVLAVVFSVLTVCELAAAWVVYRRD
jgi:hypothetical protein